MNWRGGVCFGEAAFENRSAEQLELIEMKGKGASALRMLVLTCRERIYVCGKFPDSGDVDK
jgi:hypothetical protein